MDSRYKHLGSEERGVILAEHRRGSSLREIGLVLGRAPSTIGRELARGGSGEESWLRLSEQFPAKDKWCSAEFHL